MGKRIGWMPAVMVGFVGWVLGGAPSLCQAQLVSSFEHNLTSSVGATWDGPGIPSSEYTPVGATDGSTALAIHHETAWTIQAWLKGGVPLAQAAASHDFL